MLRPGTDRVLRLTGQWARAFEAVRDGEGLVPATLEGAIAGLIELGIVRSDAWTRRRVLQLGAAGAMGAIAVIGLPSVAAAASSTTTVSTDPPTPGNLIMNPSFEAGTPGSTAPAWTIG